MNVNKPQNALLFVEGRDDQHVVWALCKSHAIVKNFDIKRPIEQAAKADGIDQLFLLFEKQLRIGVATAVGIMLDANSDLDGRWQNILNCIQKVNLNYQSPDNPDKTGTIIESPDGYAPRLGIWIMPNNQLSGELEDFVSWLIPDKDELAPHAENVLTQIEADDLHRYRHKHSKAFVHTWLAWQEQPGMPMGQAITAKALSANSLIAHIFVDWLNRLFNS
ncbi:MAG: hypothetical protein GWP17_02665 [Aquificales bacterium]|nr:hypothetical protein [Aquificales bacterium]